MKTIRNTLVIGATIVLAFIGDAPSDNRLGFQLVPEAHAVFGVWRRHARRWAVVGTAAAVASTEAAAAAAASTPPPASPPPSAPSPSPASASSDGTLPLGTVVDKLPEGCVDTPVGGIDYHYCGGNFYRSAFQGNKLVYVTAKP